MDEFRSVRMEALLMLGGYDIDATTEELRAKLCDFYNRRAMRPLPAFDLPLPQPHQS